jgi:hypothetical protein
MSYSGSHLVELRYVPRGLEAQTLLEGVVAHATENRYKEHQCVRMRR